MNDHVLSIAILFMLPPTATNNRRRRHHVFGSSVRPLTPILREATISVYLVETGEVSLKLTTANYFSV